ncbi:lipocalin family protein [Mesonia sp. HuA40]|uniref:lipocalin family protein n=1 Tax=Mesonia sp. HuA40 TaxID=2602761 RepID=UPI0011C9793F|nr:lipocalin family protein [Mesonia sp. HuA40]TXK70983.1 lipocalin [Mesonia sp. HuA40]
MNRIVILLISALLLQACGTTKVERQAERTFKGDWTLTDISYPGSSGFVDVNLFQDAKANCFRGSNWSFVSNNNQGQYSLSGANCEQEIREIVWTVEETDENSGLYYFTLKVLKDGQKARFVKTGFKLRLTQLSESNMTWEQTVSFEGKPFVIRMDFVKNNY